ncbi:MAG TPA: hypothetical protein VGC95_12200 [Chitinophagaceae bacterium]|jgi:hypothetical protein
MARDEQNRNSRADQRKKEQTGGGPSLHQSPGSALESNRNLSAPEERHSQPGDNRTFNLVIDSVPYMVRATAFQFNGETRYKVTYNGGAEHVFTWDSSLGQLRAIDDESSTMPDDLEMAISERLQSIR